MIGLLDLASKAFKVDDNEFVSNGGGRTNEKFINLSKNNKSRNLTYMPNIRAIKKRIFLIPNAKKIFNYLQLMFIKALIF